jgi:two-component system, OmpR family, response regulator PhoP
MKSGIGRGLMSGEEFKQAEVANGPLVYLVDDDEGYREEMALGLSRLGLDVHAFHGAAALYRAYAARPSDIVILDICLEGEDGLSIAAHLRATRSVGIIMATGRSSVDDRIKGLERGADVYLVKPVDVRELAATVAALNQRLTRQRATLPLAIPRWTIEEGGWVLCDGVGHRLRLTTSEQRFLGRLFQERGKTVERRALVEAIGADVYEFDYSHLDTLVSRLRRRAERSNMLIPLHAIRGLGFAFTG